MLSRVPYKWSRVPYITCPGFPIYYPGYRICGPGSHILTKSYDPFAVIMKYCRMISFQLKWDTVIGNQYHALTHAEFIITYSFSVKIRHCHMIPFSLKMRHHIFFCSQKGNHFIHHWMSFLLDIINATSLIMMNNVLEVSCHFLTWLNYIPGYFELIQFFIVSTTKNMDRIIICLTHYHIASEVLKCQR